MHEMGLSKQVIQETMRKMHINLYKWGQQAESLGFDLLKESLQDMDNKPSASGDPANAPFWMLRNMDKEIVRKEVRRISQALKTKIALRNRHSTKGKLDVRSIVRHNMKYGGVPIDLRYTSKKLKPNLVVLLDLSTSMINMSDVMLQFLYSLQDQIGSTHAFGFIDHLEYITP